MVESDYWMIRTHCLTRHLCHKLEDAAREFNSTPKQVRSLLDESRNLLLLDARNQIALVQAVRQGGDKLERLDDLGLRSRSSSV